MNLKKQSIILLLIVLAFGAGQYLMKHLNQNSSPEKVALYFLTNHLKPDEVKKNVTLSDSKTLEVKGLDFLKLAKLSVKPYGDLSIAADVALTESAHKVDVKSNQGLVSLSVVKEGDRWVIFFNLKEKHEINVLLEQISDAELREDEFEMLSLYKKINEKLPSEDYVEKITRLEKYIARNKKQADYVKNIYVDSFKLVGRVLTAAVKNQGNEKVKSIKGNLQIIDPIDGSIKKEIAIVVYEIIPGSFVFGEPILPNYMKKIGLNVESVPEITEKSTIYITVTSVEFME